MKSIYITYCMKNGSTTTKAHITLPVTDEIARRVLSQGDTSGAVQQTLKSLSTIQGRTFGGFICAREVNL